MIETIIGALLPVVVTLLLGFVAGWHQDFDSAHALILNRMVMLYALPLALFAGMVGISRDQVLSQGPLALAILIGMGGGYAVVFLGERRRRDHHHKKQSVMSLRNLAINALVSTVLHAVNFEAAPGTDLVEAYFERGWTDGLPVGVDRGFACPRGENLALNS
jgi:predicted permease